MRSRKKSSSCQRPSQLDGASSTPTAGQQLVSGGEVQGRAHGVEVGLPAGNGNFAARLEASQRLQLQVGVADLYTLERVAARDEQGVAPLPGVHERVRCGHVQAPAVPHGSGEGVGEHETAPVEVQPQVAMEQQGVARVLEPPTSLYHEQRLPGLDAEGRQAGPRRANLARIDRPRRFGEGRAQSRIGLVAPDLGVGQVAFALGQRDAVRHARCPGPERDPPGAGAHLDLQIAVGRQPQGKCRLPGRAVRNPPAGRVRSVPAAPYPRR